MDKEIPSGPYTESRSRGQIGGSQSTVRSNAKKFTWSTTARGVGK
jgi:hypothetical protein